MLNFWKKDTTFLRVKRVAKADYLSDQVKKILTSQNQGLILMVRS